MEKNASDTNRKKKSFRDVMKSGWGGAIVITMLFIAAMCLYPGNNIFTLMAVKKDIEAQNEEISRLKAEIAGMEERIHTLKTNRDSLERFARENFHMAIPGEDIYLVDE